MTTQHDNEYQHGPQLWAWPTTLDPRSCTALSPVRKPTIDVLGDAADRPRSRPHAHFLDSDNDSRGGGQGGFLQSSIAIRTKFSARMGVFGSSTLTPFSA